MKNLCILFGLLFVASSYAALAPESRGIDFFVAFAYNYQNGLGQTQTLFISSDVAQSVIVRTSTAVVATVSVAAHSTSSAVVSSIYIPTVNTVGNYGIRVYSPSNTSFTLVGLNSYTATTDAFLAFPVNVLGTNHMVASYTACCSVSAYVYVVGTQDSTSVTISGPRTLTGYSSGTASFTLNAYQTVAVGITNGDITGFTVNSNKPLAVFGGAACANIPTNVGACNVLVDQIPPTNTWASDFITVPIATRTAGDIIRVVSNTTGTVVNVNGANVATLAFGAWYEFSSSIPNIITTSYPALVMQYDKGSGADGVSSDPFQIWIPPVNQFSANYYITAPTGTYWTNFVNIVVKSGSQSGITLDAVAPSVTWKPISGLALGNSYVYAQVPLTGGSHTVSHTSPIEQFEVIVYGFGSYDGYGYVGGNRLAPLQDPCTQTTTIPGDGIDNDCDNRIDEEIRNGVDDDGDGLIDEDLTVDTCCYSNFQNPVTSPASIAAVNIYCGDSLPSVPSVSATVACANITNFALTPSTTTTGSCPSGQTVTRTWTVVDACGRTASVSQVITVSTPASVCGNGVIEASEQCDGGSCCSSSCTFQSSSTVCRSSSGDCDVAETCTGSSSTCPSDSFQSSSTVCRASSGDCDVAESCTGSSASCPSDSFQSSSTVCRSSSGDCDVAESCTGSTASCPSDSFQSSSTVCRSSSGDCDVAESCTGSSSTCPSDSFQSSSTICRASSGDCDVAESCTGSTASCPSDSFQSSSTVCRSSSGVCDVEESCTGSSSTCPSDSFQSSSTVCRAAAGSCDVAESCTGSSSSCPSDSFQSSSTVCRAAIGPCDDAESCTGSSSDCPADVSGSFETACAGLNIDLGSGPVSILNYDVISFGNLVGPTGAIDGRAAVKGDVVVGTSYAGGYSVGYYVHSDSRDQTLAYALVAGGNLTFGGGAVYPDGLHNGPKEDIFVGTGSSNGQADLVARSTGTCSTSNCLGSAFDAVQACYGAYQTEWSTHGDNVAKTIQWSGLYLDCNDATSAVKQYYLTLSPSEMTQYTWISMSNCNANARWIISVSGTGPVTFTAGSFPAAANSVVYSVTGSGRTVNVQNVYLQGHLIAPYNTLNQPSGNIVGKVVAGNIPSTLNINRASGSQCFTPS